MSDFAAIFGRVSRVIDVPSQGITYLRIEVPVEYHAELTQRLYNRDVVVALAGPSLKGAPYGPLKINAEGETHAPARKAVVKAAPKDHPKGGKLCADAARVCSEPEFIAFAWRSIDGTSSAGEVPADFGSDDAAEYMRDYCGVESRAYLDHDPEAARKFGELMREYRESQGLSS